MAQFPGPGGFPRGPGGGLMPPGTAMPHPGMPQGGARPLMATAGPGFGGPATAPGPMAPGLMPGRGPTGPFGAPAGPAPMGAPLMPPGSAVPSTSAPRPGFPASAAGPRPLGGPAPMPQPATNPSFPGPTPGGVPPAVGMGPRPAMYPPASTTPSAGPPGVVAPATARPATQPPAMFSTVPASAPRPVSGGPPASTAQPPALFTAGPSPAAAGPPKASPVAQPPPLFAAGVSNTSPGPTPAVPTPALAPPPGALAGIPGSVPPPTTAARPPLAASMPPPPTSAVGPPRPGVFGAPPTASMPPTGGPPRALGPPVAGQPTAPIPAPAVKMYSLSAGGAPATSTPTTPSGSVDASIPSAFGAGSYSNLYGPGGSMSGPPSSVPTSVAPPIDPALNCDSKYMQLTMGAIPASATLATSASLPFGLCVHPLAKDPTLKPVQVVDFGQAGVIRCKRCRTYINPFAAFMDAGRRWKCNMCLFINDVPHAYHGPIDDMGRRTDASTRPELSQGSVEFVAPVEYMVRPPQPPVYMFVIDVSYPAVTSGVVHTVCAAIKQALPTLPGGERTQIGFVTYNSSVHFYNLRPTLSAPAMLVVPDISDIFLPVPDDLLVNLSESRALVDQLLDSLPKMHTDAKNVETCLGTALDAAFNIMQHIGGKMVVCQTSLPSLGKGKLKHRENPKTLGTDTEHTLFAPDPSNDAQYYKHKAVDFSRQQISVDTFLIGTAYLDVATVGCISRYTAGHVYHYTQFTRAADAERLTADILHDLKRDTGFEAVMRIRCTRGLRVTNFYGNFFIRGTDLLALPNVTEDTAFNVELAHEEVLTPGTIIGIQAALLYTTSTGERRINVHTMAAPVTQLLADLFKKVDVNSVGNMLAKLALDQMLRVSVSASRLFLHKAIVDIVRAYRQCTTAGYNTAPSFPGANPTAAQQPYLPEDLASLPLLALALQKCVLFRGGTDVKSDERSALVYRMLTMPVAASKWFIKPLLAPLHRLEPEDGRPLVKVVDSPSPSPSADELRIGEDQVKMPRLAANLSGESLTSDGAFLLFDGVETFLWFGRAVPPGLLEALFGVSTLEGVDTSQLSLPVLPNDYSQRVHAMINALHSVAAYQPNIVIVREGSSSVAEARFHWRLVEDRTNFHGGSIAYPDYLAMVVRESQMASTLH